MKPVFFSLFFLACFVTTAFSQPKNEAVSNGAFFDGEPYLAVNPTNTNNMIIAWMSYVPNPGRPLLEQLGIRVRSSFDGGQTWGHELTMPHFSPTFHSADVSMAFHGSALFMSYVDYRQNPDSGAILVARSDDGGMTWHQPVKAFDGYDNNDKPIDRPWIAVDNSGTATDGTIYITTKPAPWDPMPNRPYMKYSTDNGLTWSKIDTVDGGDYLTTLISAPMVSPAVTSDGIFRAAYLSWNLQKALYPRFTLASSTDFGKTYNRTTIVGLHGKTTADTLSKLGQHLAVDPKNPQNLLLTWIDARDGDPDVYATVSHDGGVTWSTEIRINDDPKNNGVWQDLVWANYSENGKCVISWRDRRKGDSTEYAKGSDIYFAVSTDGGTTFGKNIRLSDQTAPFNIVLNGAGNDFQSTAIVHDSLCISWGDVRTGKLAIYFVKASLSDGIATVIPVSEEDSRISIFPNPASHSLSLRLKLDEPDRTDLFIYDGTGEEIWHDMTSGTNMVFQVVDVSKFSTGIYTVVAKTSRETFSQKLTVVR